ncbi:MAG: ribonuclease R family protein [Cyanobacteria bacterium P01_A01_bin.3]
MDFSVPQLFAQFVPSAGDSDDSDIPPRTRSALAEALGTESSEYLDVALDALTRIGHIVRVDGDDEPGYTKNPESKLVEGQLRCSSKGFCFAISHQPGVDDIYIHGSNLNGAWNGDRVIAKVVKEGNRRRSPEGHVAAVIERANPTVVAKLEKKDGDETALKGVPLDDRLLFELDLAFPNLASVESESPTSSSSDPDTTEAAESLLETSNASPSHRNGGIPPEAEPGKFVYVEVERYPLAQIPPLGLVRKVLGSDSGTSMDTDLVCCKHNLPQAFPEALETAAAKIRCKLNKTDLKKRQDCRDWYTLALSADNDPAQLAVSLDRQEDSSWRLGIHISDVAQTLLADHPVNLEAQERGQAIHLNDVTVPLFPERVLQQCSFVAGSDRPAISIVYTLTPNGVAQSYSIQQTSVCCDTRLTLEQAQSLVESDEGGESNMARLLQHLMALQEVFQEQRHESGGWDLPQPATHQPRPLGGTADEGNQSAVSLAPSPSVASLVTELQVLANATIAKHFKELGVPALYRGCPLPGVETVQTFLRLVDNLKMEISLQDDETLTLSDLQQFARGVSSAPEENRSHLTQQLLNVIPAASECLEPQLHCGVGYNPYCHATAPLTRYVDLIHQRLLHDIISKGRDRRSSRVKTGVDILSSSSHGQVNWSVLPPKRHKEWAELLQVSLDHLNAREVVAREAETELAGLKRSEYMQQHVGKTVTGLIVGVQNYGFFVLTDLVLAEGLVHVSSLKDDWYEYRSRQQALVGRKSRQQFQVGDRIEVEVKSVDYYRQQIDLGVIGGGKPYEGDDD